MTARRRLRGTAACLLAWVALSGIVLPQASGADSSGVVYLRTVPAVAGVHLRVGSAFVTTDGAGRASAQVADLNGISSTVALADRRLNPSTTVAISHVVPAPHTIPHVSNLAVGLDLRSRVRLHISGGRTGVSPSAVVKVRLHSVTGHTVTLDPHRRRTVNLLSRVTRLNAGTLTTQHVTWSVDSITAGPGVALTTSTPRFDPLYQRVWDLELQPVHGVVQVDTVPPTPGVVFLIEGATFTTGKNGRASAPVGDLNNVDERLRLRTHAAGSDRVSLLQVHKLPPLAVHQRRLLAALAVRDPVSMRFFDVNGRPIDPNRISQVRLAGGGSVVQLTGAQAQSPVMLTTGVATQVNRRWRSRPIMYRVQSVRLDGGDAVFAGQQRFDPNGSSTWPVTLAMFDLTVTARDALFGQPIGSKVLITRPNGKLYTVQIGSGGTRVRSMVRGKYGLTVASAVLGGHTTVLVSRNDAVDLRVVTLLDVVVVALVGLLIIAATLAVGSRMSRRHQARHRRNPQGAPLAARPATRQTSWPDQSSRFSSGGTIEDDHRSPNGLSKTRR